MWHGERRLAGPIRTLLPYAVSAATSLLPFVWARVLGLTRRRVARLLHARFAYVRRFRVAVSIHGNVLWLALHHDASCRHYAYRLV